MKSVAFLSHRYHFGSSISNRLFQPYLIAILAVVLSCLCVCANSAKAQQASSVTCNNDSFSSAGTDSCKVSLSSVAKKQTAVYLYSSGSVLKLPPTVDVRAGASSVSFTAAVSSVSSVETVLITARASTRMAWKATYAILLEPSTQTPTLAVNATTISFGSVTTKTDAMQTVTLRSTGTAAVTVKSAAVTGTGFTFSGSSFPVTLNPGQALNLEVQFAPTVAGSSTGQLTISSNSSSNPTRTIPLSGTATTPSHDVALSWNAPASASLQVVGYNVYRAPSGTTSFARLNSSLIGSTGYTDAAVTAGQTYLYEVKSVDSAGIESAPSNTSTAVVP